MNRFQNGRDMALLGISALAEIDPTLIAKSARLRRVLS
jgi:hypothetical protein